MANVNVSTNVSFTVEIEEKEALKRTHDILENIRHQWFVSDNDAWDNEDYWEVENAVKMLERLFGCAKAREV